MVLALLLAACHHEKKKELPFGESIFSNCPPEENRAEQKTKAMSVLLPSGEGAWTNKKGKPGHYFGNVGRVVFHNNHDDTIYLRYVKFDGDSIIENCFLTTRKDSISFYDSVYHYDSAVLR